MNAKVYTFLLTTLLCFSVEAQSNLTVSSPVHTFMQSTTQGQMQDSLGVWSLTTDVMGILPKANGGTGTATPGLVAGTNVTITGDWPNQTINASGGGGGSALAYSTIDLTVATALSVGTAYDAGSVSANVTFAALPAGANGDEIKLLFRATTTVSFDFAANNADDIFRVGETSDLSTVIYFPTGNHWINFRKSGGFWIMADSGTDSQGETPFIIKYSDNTTPFTAGVDKGFVNAPYALTILGVKANLKGASSAGPVTLDIKENGVSILSTPLTIDQSELTSLSAVVPAVVSDTSIANDALISIEVVGAGTNAFGGSVTIYYSR